MNGMNDKDKEKKGLTFPNMPMIKGLLAIIFGIMIIAFSFKMILHIIFFTTGAFLIYYGLVVLQIKQATDYIDMIIERIRRLLSR